MNVVLLFSLGTTTAKDYLKAGILRNFNLLKAKVNPWRHILAACIIMQYTHKYKLKLPIFSVYVRVRFFQCLKLTNYSYLKLMYFII